MKIWHILVGAGVVVGGIVLMSGPSGLPLPPPGPDRANGVCAHIMEVAKKSGVKATSSLEQCQAFLAAEGGKISDEDYRCIMGAMTFPALMDCLSRSRGDV